MRTEQPVDVLVIGDREGGRKAMLDALQRQVDSIRAISVPSSVEALRFLASCSVLPKVVLLDMGLADMDPFELLRRIRSVERTKSLPVFLMTDAMDRERKPLTPYVLINGYIPRTADTQLAKRLTILRHLVGQRSAAHGERN
jgi:two-component system cell cycle response regulator